MSKSAQEAVQMLDFDEEKMVTGQIEWNWEPRPPEMIIACWVDKCGSPHYYMFECVGTVSGEEEMERVWVHQGNVVNESVKDSLEKRHGKLVEWPVTDIDGFTESAWQHSFESDKRYNERCHSTIV